MVSVCGGKFSHCLVTWEVYDTAQFADLHSSSLPCHYLPVHAAQIKSQQQQQPVGKGKIFNLKANCMEIVHILRTE